MIPIQVIALQIIKARGGIKLAHKPTLMECITPQVFPLQAYTGTREKIV